ncbi:MAG: phytanoyl-CoA dioxygenase family protein [Alphaproteobacteria bacterium]|jgi:ectoine hydroxylase-related dioxygenase (phytanoyl-CoA dioxygenase family)
MKSTFVRDVTEAEIKQYETDGIVLLKGLFDADWLSQLADLVDADMAAPGPLHLELEKGDAGGRFFFDTFMWTRMDGFKSFVFDSPAAALAGAVMRSSKTNIIFDQLLIKEPGTEEPTPWHHDLTYWPVGGSRICTLWLALDKVDAQSGAVEYIKGSHKWGAEYTPPAFAGDDRYKTDLPPVPDIEAERAKHDIVQFDMEPGDCTIHHALLVHGAPGNARSDRRRRAVVTRWAGDDAIYKPHAKIQPMAWTPDIPAGGPLDSDLWPVVWRREA